MLKAIAIGLLGASSAAFGQTLFTATLQGSQEVPANGSAAGGTATLILNAAQTRLTISIDSFGIDFDGMQTPGTTADNLTIAHIHRNFAGANGPVVFGFVGPNSDMNGDLVIDPVQGTIMSAWDLTEGNNTTLGAELANLFAEGLYINLHTVMFPGGEIRGQIVPTPSAVALFGAAGLGLLRRRR